MLKKYNIDCKDSDCSGCEYYKIPNKHACFRPGQCIRLRTRDCKDCICYKGFCTYPNQNCNNYYHFYAKNDEWIEEI